MMGGEIRGLAELQAKITRLARDFPGEILRGMNRAVLYVHGEIPPYPAPPDGSDYRRTGTLGRSITTEVRSVGNEVVGLIGTSVVYAPYVISDEPSADGRGPQAWMHAGRWWALQGVVREHIDGVITILSDTVRRLLNG